MAKKKSNLRKKVDKASRVITKAVGAKNLARYAGESIAKRKNSNVERTVTKKQAIKSGVSLAANIASLAAGGAAGGTVRAASNARKAVAVKKAAKAKAATKRSNAFLKRTYSGHEKEAFRQAKIRNARKKK